MSAPKPMFLIVNPFVAECTPKERVLKPLEEAAEVFAAWQGTSNWGDDLAYEIADCIQACVNLAAFYDLDLDYALVRVEDSNRKRGRYHE